MLLSLAQFQAFSICYTLREAYAGRKPLPALLSASNVVVLVLHQHVAGSVLLIHLAAMVRISLGLHHSVKHAGHAQWLLAGGLARALQQLRPSYQLVVIGGADKHWGTANAAGIQARVRQFLQGHKRDELRILVEKAGDTATGFLHHATTRPGQGLEWELRTRGSKKRVAIPAFSISLPAAEPIYEHPFLATPYAAQSKVHLKVILKGFSVFVKWLRSRMPLIVLCENHNAMQEARLAVQDYRYRQQVLIQLQEPGVSPHLANAYAVVLHQPPQTSSQQLMLAAMQQEVALISTEKILLQQRADPDMQQYLLEVSPQPDGIGKALVELYRNEAMRAELVQGAKRLAQQFSPMQTAEALLHSLHL